MSFTGLLLLSGLLPPDLRAEQPWSVSSDAPVTTEITGFNREARPKAHGSSTATLFFSFYSEYISPLDGATCRYYPTCSHYTETSIEKYGSIKGILMGFDRLIRCHPGQNDSHFDPPVDY